MPQAPPLAALLGQLRRFARPGVPKYVAMRDALAHAIASGEWPAETRLPTESECAAALPLSLGTIQRALRGLAEDGLITRRQGRGSFIAAGHGGRMHAPLHCRFVNGAGDGYLPVYPRVLARVEESRAGPWTQHLHARRIVRIDRVLRIGEEFSVFGRFWFDPVRLPALATLPTRKLSAENFKEIIWRESHQSIGRLSQLLSTTVLPAEACRALALRPGTRGQRLEICAFVGRDSPIYYQELCIPPHRRRLHLAADGRDAGLNGQAGSKSG